MSEAPISDEIALRIALAARALPDVSLARLIKVLEDAVALPPTPEKLANLKVKDLKSALDGELADVDQGALKAALTILKGEDIPETAPPPALIPYAEGDMPGSIRVACASSQGEELDGHFGSAPRFLIYQVSADESRLIDVRYPQDATAEDKNAARAELIADCQVLYVASIGGPAAAKVVKHGTHPIKDDAGGSAARRIEALREVLSDKAPPWLAKVMGRSPEAQVRFEREGAEA